MEAIFTFQSRSGKGIPTNPHDLELYFLENEGEDIMVTMKPLAKVSEKMKLFAYLFGPLMDAAVRGYIYQGYTGIDRVQARYKLQAEFCKKELYNEKTMRAEYTLEDLSGMTKNRLLQFVVDCVFFIEENLGQRTPDSAEYKAMRGDGFLSTKFRDEK